MKNPRISTDPRTMTQEEIINVGHLPKSPMKVIREKCLDCCCGSANEVKLCSITDCPLWPFRMGKNPWRKPVSEDEKERRREMFKETLGAR